MQHAPPIRQTACFCLALVLCLLQAGRSVSAEDRLNVVVILADDLGWTDLASYGSDFHETPCLDQLALDGMTFTQSYSACTVCSPTRAALLTGKAPARLRVTDWIPGMMPDNPKLLVPNWTKELPAEELTLAEAFQQAGYQTASIGKWHLGGEDSSPEQHGFAVNVGGTHAPSTKSFFAPWKISTLSEGEPGEYLTDRLGQIAETFIKDCGDDPFFLYLAHYAVHLPIQAPEELTERFRSQKRPGQTHVNAQYAAMLYSMDQTVGQVRAALESQGVQDRTLIVFTSDNGGRVPTTSNAPLRYGKASAYEGGVRVPLIISWPGITMPGSVCDTPVITMDLFPTLLEACNIPISTAPTGSADGAPAAPGCDGTSLAPLLRQTGELAARDLFWHYPHHQHYQLGGATPYGAIRSGDYRFVEFYNDMQGELYRVTTDIGEETNLADALPEIAADLRERLHAWREHVAAQMPTPNPNFDANRPEYTPPEKPKPVQNQSKP